MLTPICYIDGLVSYSGPQGSRRGAELDLSDQTYDGKEDNAYLRRGLGQLVDGQKGQDNFRLDISGRGKGKAHYTLLLPRSLFVPPDPNLAAFTFILGSLSTETGKV